MILQPQIPVEQQSIQSPGSPLRGLWQKCYCAFSKKPIYCSAGAWVYFVKCFSRKMDQNYFSSMAFFFLCLSSYAWMMTFFFQVFFLFVHSLYRDIDIILYIKLCLFYDMMFKVREVEVPNDTVSGIIEIWVIWVVVPFEHSKDKISSTGSKNMKLVDLFIYFL